MFVAATMRSTHEETLIRQIKIYKAIYLLKVFFIDAEAFANNIITKLELILVNIWLKISKAFLSSSGIIS